MRGVDPFPGREAGLALGQPGGRGAYVQEGVGARQGVAHTQLPGRPQGLHGGLRGPGRLRGDGRGRPARRLPELAAGHHLADEADLPGPPRREALVAAQEREPGDLSEGHAWHHDGRLVHGGHAEGEVGVEERGVLGGDDELHLAEQVEGARAGHAVDGGDDRLPAPVGLRAEPRPGVVPCERVELGDAVGGDVRPVDAGAEGALARGGEHDAPHGVVVADAGPHVGQLDLHLLVEGVVDLGAVEHDPAHAPVPLVPERLEVSRRLSWRHALPAQDRSGYPNRGDQRGAPLHLHMHS